LPLTLQSFVDRWSGAQRAERANYQLFLSELCEVLDLPRPDPAGPDAAANAYVFERAVRLHHRDGTTTTGRIDLYRRGCFVLECKQYGEAKPESAALALDFTDEPAPRSAGIVRGTEAWDRKMHEAREQAKRYVDSLPADEDPPPFIVTVDVGHSFELFADFSQKGKAYLHHPDARTFRIRLRDLLQEEPRERLRAVWLDPHSLDQSKKAAAVTREVAEFLAKLARLFEKHHEPKLVAAFLSRCLFCMFAEDVGLLPKESFKQLLDSVKGAPGAAVPLLKALFEEMNRGGYSLVLREKLLHFNGGLFASAAVLPLDGPQLGLLRKAASLEWRHVEPAIFGTLLERALDPAERHKLGAHYTPRAYVERLVLPTVIEPLRDEWENVRAAAITLATRGDLKAAIKETRAFHHRLCGIRVLDPACGSGNFLYVTLEHMKRLEGEVLELVESFGDNMRLDLAGETVDPHQFLGLELNPRAASVAELVLWIGHLQWHHRNRGSTHWPEPVLHAFRNIECRDAVLAYDAKDFARDESGKTRYVWDRRTYKVDPATGREIPDEKAVRPLETFKNPRPAVWPEADFIVGNPPFLGNKRMRDELGDGYAETLRAAYPEVTESADFVMYWWHKAAALAGAGRARRFGFITTNSIRQSSNRRVVQAALDKGIYLTFAIPDHPWIDSTECAAVRIAMTVGAPKPSPTVGALSCNALPPSAVGALTCSAHPSRAKPASKIASKLAPTPAPEPGRLHAVTAETPDEETGEHSVQLSLDLGTISADLTSGANITATKPLLANEGLSFMGVTLVGDFTITPSDLANLGLAGKNKPPVVKSYLIGKDLTQTPRGVDLIDFFGLEEDEARKTHPKLFERLLKVVKPLRDQNKRDSYRKKWWIFGEPRTAMRAALAGLPRFIATPETAKHRFFIFLPTSVVLDHTAFAIASSDAFHLGVLSSRIHSLYALAAGSRLGVGNDPRYRNGGCFDPFPFPECTEVQKAKIRQLAEELDAHRKRAQQQHGLGLTDIYNVLEKLRAAASSVSVVGAPTCGALSGEPRAPQVGAPTLTTKEQAIHDAALVSTLKHLHDELDAAVADAYGWPWPLADEEILERVVALNAARAAEEANGTIRWLRPEYQLRNADRGLRNEQTKLDLTEGSAPDSKSNSRKSARGKTSPATPQSEIRNPKSAAKRPWPKPLAERAQAVEAALAAEPKPITAAELATRFARAKPADVAEILDTLAALGRARRGDTKGTFLR
jgi:hypothetical protein